MDLFPAMCKQSEVTPKGMEIWLNLLVYLLIFPQKVHIEMLFSPLLRVILSLPRCGLVQRDFI